MAMVGKSGRAAVGMWQKVVSVAQSPMNKLRWVLRLECGHEAWITLKSRPTRDLHGCLECSDPK